MHEHMTADELLDELPPAERAALEYEARVIATPSTLDFGGGKGGQFQIADARRSAFDDISD